MEKAALPYYLSAARDHLEKRAFIAKGIGSVIDDIARLGAKGIGAGLNPFSKGGVPKSLLTMLGLGVGGAAGTEGLSYAAKQWDPNVAPGSDKYYWNPNLQAIRLRNTTNPLSYLWETAKRPIQSFNAGAPSSDPTQFISEFPSDGRTFTGYKNGVPQFKYTGGGAAKFNPIYEQYLNSIGGLRNQDNQTTNKPMFTIPNIEETL